AAARVAAGHVPGDRVAGAAAQVVGHEEPAAGVEPGDVARGDGVARAVEVHAHVTVVLQDVLRYLDVRALRDQDRVELRVNDHETAHQDVVGGQDHDPTAARHGQPVHRLLALRVDHRSGPADEGQRLRDHGLGVVHA